MRTSPSWPGRPPAQASLPSGKNASPYARCARVAIRFSNLQAEGSHTISSWYPPTTRCLPSGVKQSAFTTAALAYLACGAGGTHRTRNSFTKSAFGSIPASSFAPSVIHRATTAAFSFGTTSPLSFGGIRFSSVELISEYNSLSAGLPGVIGSPFDPPAGSFSNVVMSNLPDFFLASWQAKQFSFRIGATSLMKLTGASAALAAGVIVRAASTAAARAQRTQKQ